MKCKQARHLMVRSKCKKPGGIISDVPETTCPYLLVWIEIWDGMQFMRHTARLKSCSKAYPAQSNRQGKNEVNHSTRIGGGSLRSDKINGLLDVPEDPPN
jgi:hypothetical protein